MGRWDGILPWIYLLLSIPHAGGPELRKTRESGPPLQPMPHNGTCVSLSVSRRSYVCSTTLAVTFLPFALIDNLTAALRLQPPGRAHHGQLELEP